MDKKKSHGEIQNLTEEEPILNSLTNLKNLESVQIAGNNLILTFKKNMFIECLSEEEAKRQKDFILANMLSKKED